MTPATVVPVPSKVTVELLQLISAVGPASAVGIFVSCVMTTSEEVTLQPLSLSVTVTLYVPAAVTVIS